MDPPDHDCTAREVSDYLLTRSGDAMLANDFALFASCFEVPQDLETFEGRKRVETMEGFKQTFDAVRAYYRKAGVTALVRHCVEAEFKGPDLIEATHSSRLVSGTVLVGRPHTGFSVLRRRDGVWRVASSKYAIIDADELNHALTS